MAIQNQKKNSRCVHGECIGKGSYGTVSLGIQQSDGRFFAVKSADKDSLSSMEALENEIEILRSLSSSSPFIVEHYGDDETSSQKNLYLEYLPGGDVATAGEVPDAELIRSYTWCLVMALRTVHSKGIVHCDVKGSNVLLGPTIGVAKLADFGTAMRVDFDRRSKIVPRGSPLWMAPEVVRGESQGFEADIWSLGCTVIQMFTGKPAWQDSGAHTLFQIGYSDDVPEYPTRVSELGRDFLDKCLNRDPDRRWSCDQLLQHPFLLPAPANKIIEPSPKSIFDLQSLNFSIDDDDDHVAEEDHDLDEISVRYRIGKLATMSGPNWESDGWVEVRENRVAERRTSSEIFDLEEDNEVITQRVVWEDDFNYPTWINFEDEDERESDGGAGGDRCGHGGGGWMKIDSCGGEKENIVTVVMLISLLFLLFLLYSPTSMGFNSNNHDNDLQRLLVDQIYASSFMLPIFMM